MARQLLVIKAMEMLSIQMNLLYYMMSTGEEFS